MYFTSAVKLSITFKISYVVVNTNKQTSKNKNKLHYIQRLKSKAVVPLCWSLQ